MPMVFVLQRRFRIFVSKSERPSILRSAFKMVKWMNQKKTRSTLTAFCSIRKRFVSTRKNPNYQISANVSIRLCGNLSSATTGSNCIPPMYNFLLFITKAIDGMLPLSIDQSSSIDIHNLMNQIYVSFPAISYSCFLFDDYFVQYRVSWSFLDLVWFAQRKSEIDALLPQPQSRSVLIRNVIARFDAECWRYGPFPLWYRFSVKDDSCIGWEDGDSRVFNSIWEGES